MMRTLFLAFLFGLVVWVWMLALNWHGGGRVQAHDYWTGYRCEAGTGRLYQAHWHAIYNGEYGVEVGHYLHKHYLGYC
jgi:hypothetical protein